VTEQTGSSIDIPFPSDTYLKLRITAAPARLTLAPGDHESWVQGTYNDPGGSTQSRVTIEGGTARIGHERNLMNLRQGLPAFDLALGKAKPYRLTLETGASDRNTCDLGGLPLREVDCKLGAGRFQLDFSTPNPEEMEKLSIAAGASELAVLHMANAGAREATINGGAASMTFDFSGTLQRNFLARINSGMAEVKIRVPKETPARIRCDATLGSLDLSDGFMTREGQYWNEAALARDENAETPLLSLEVMTALGSIKIEQV
jgi:hypothetical protein